MPKKSRTPPPPRKPIQAPKARAGGPRLPPGGERRARHILYGAAASGLVALVVVLVVIFATGGGGGGSSTAGLTGTLTAAGCTFKTYPGLTATHVAETAKPKRNSFPPTTGPHSGTPAIWGAYPTPVAQIQALHNLEHGGIVVQYGDKVPEATVASLKAFYDESPNAMLMAPLPKLGGKVALEAWTKDVKRAEKEPKYAGEGRLALCTRYDEKAYNAFRDAFRGKGPERFPVDLLVPGSN